MVFSVQKTQQAFKVIGCQLCSCIGLHQKVHVRAGRLLRRVALQCFEKRTGMRRVDDDKFVHQMDPQLRKLFMRKYPTHSDIVPTNAATQRKSLQLKLVAAQIAEDQWDSIASIVERFF